MKIVNVLVISDKYDFTTDFVCLELEKKNADYLRLNRDEFRYYQIYMETDTFNISITINGSKYIITEEALKGIYYRAPVFLRQANPNWTLEEQLYREQWMAFMRNLLIFENVIWMNNPEKTYKAENKIVQLKYAKKIGLDFPYTIVTNTIPTLTNDKYIVKSLDTAIFNINEKEAFIYSNILTKEEIQNSSLELAPVTIQDYIKPKVDIRVTVIGYDVYATSITRGGEGVDIDWRMVKDNVEFSGISLPQEIEEKCIKLVRELGLNFGAIDLLKTGDKYLFLEINPTGEWAWLAHKIGQTIPQSISEMLVAGP